MRCVVLNWQNIVAMKELPIYTTHKIEAHVGQLGYTVFACVRSHWNLYKCLQCTVYTLYIVTPMRECSLLTTWQIKCTSEKKSEVWRARCCISLWSSVRICSDVQHIYKIGIYIEHWASSIEFKLFFSLPLRLHKNEKRKSTALPIKMMLQ